MFQGRPVIVVTTLYDRARESYWMLPGYMEGLEEAGAIPLMPPLTQKPEVLDYFLDQCDGILLTGGHDVSPAVYGREPTPQCGETCPERDGMDVAFLKGAVERDLPVLGICRGFQLMNAAYGGVLYQDLPTELSSQIRHRMEPPYDRAVHTVRLEEGSPLRQLLGTEELGVNSRHHQGVRELAPCMRPMAWAEDGLVEACWMPGKRFVWGVQWHPEHAYRSSPESRQILEAFVAAAKGQ